jgi:hypothetical protein
MVVTTLVVVLVLVVWSGSSELLAHGGNPDGSWVVSITPTSGPPGTPPPPPYLALITMTTEGRVMETDIMPPCLAPSSTPGHGEWTKVAPRGFALTYLKLLSDSAGNFQGVMKINETITLDLSNTTYDGEGDLQLLDADGNVTASFGIGTQARLITVELR